MEIKFIEKKRRKQKIVYEAIPQTKKCIWHSERETGTDIHTYATICNNVNSQMQMINFWPTFIWISQQKNQTAPTFGRHIFYRVTSIR